MLKLIFLMFLTVTSFALHVHSQLQYLINAHSQNHLNSVTNLPFEKQFSTIKNQVDYVQRTLKANDSRKYSQLIAQTQNVNTGLEDLKNTLIKYKLTFSQNQKKCPGVTTFNRTDIKDSISNVQTSQKAMIDQIATCLSCSFISKDILQIQNLTKNYIIYLNATLDGIYCSQTKKNDQQSTGMVNLNISYFKNNLNAKNWFYGSTTGSDYKIYLFKRSATYNLTNCPLQKPFVSDKQQICFNCPEGKMFNLGQQNCDTCKPNEILNVQTGNCDTCNGQKHFINGSLICKPCLLSFGYLFNQTSGKCYNCSKNSYLDINSLTCIKINCSPSIPRFNFDTKLCQACGISEAIDPNNISNCIKTNYIGMCPPITPQYNLNSKSCEACPKNTIYNSNTNACDQNGVGNSISVNSHFGIATNQTNDLNLTFSNITKVTQISLNQSQSINSTAVSNTLNYSTSIINNTAYTNNDVSQNNTKIVQKGLNNSQTVLKTDNSAFSDNSTTLLNFAQPLNIETCRETQIFNMASQTCVETSTTCKNNEVYIRKVNKCISISLTCNHDQVYDSVKNICSAISSTCKRKEQYDSATKKCVLRSLRCKWNESYNQNLNICEKLILCQKNETYNKILEVCQLNRINCKQNQSYDPVTFTCLNNQYITSPYVSNLISQTRFSSYINIYNNQRSANKNLADCPLNTPYYQSRTNACISCPSTKPYFSLTTGQCISCNSQQIYDAVNHLCLQLKTNSAPDTISRMNI